MGDTAKPSLKGSDWTRLLTDPDLVSHLGLLLQTYREVSPEKRESALLQVMRGIKEQALHSKKGKAENPEPAMADPPASASPSATKMGECSRAIRSRSLSKAVAWDACGGSAISPGASERRKRCKTPMKRSVP